MMEEVPTEDMTTTTDEPLNVVVPKRYFVQIWKKIAPYDPRFDVLVGTIYWSDTQQAIKVEGLSGKYAADVTKKMGAVVELEHGIFISPNSHPKEWVRNLHLANMGGGFYATQFMESTDEIK